MTWWYRSWVLILTVAAAAETLWLVGLLDLRGLVLVLVVWSLDFHVARRRGLARGA